MPGLYSITTRATGTVLTASIYNADHQNHVDNQTPQMTDDYSTTAVEMRANTDPGEFGTESLPTSLAGELERLRFTIKELKDLVAGAAVAQWYTTIATTAADPKFNTVKLLDIDDSHSLQLVAGSNLTADRIFTLLTGDAARTLTINADTTLSGTNTGDQTITLTGGVTGSGTGSFAATVITNANLTGDITSVGNATTIAANAVTYAKMQDVSAASKLLGRGSLAGAGDPEEITIGTGLSMSGVTLSATASSGQDHYSSMVFGLI